MQNSAFSPDRALGCQLGLATGDAFGTTLEFTHPGAFQLLEEMVGGGTFQLKPGEWTDHGQIAGAYYGANGIPVHWRETIAMRDEIEKMATRLWEAGPREE